MPDINEILKHSLETVFIPTLLKVIAPTVICMIIATIVISLLKRVIPMKLFVVVKLIIFIIAIVISAKATQNAIMSVEIKIPEYTDGGNNPFTPPV
ncbi:MAG: hypothetical protein RR461_11820, partial [Angelakisella sp.]